MKKPLAICVLFLVYSCGDTNEKTDANTNKKTDETSRGETEGPAPTPGPGEMQASPQEKCDNKGPDFKWVDGTCNEIPNVETKGILSGQPGLIWEASPTTCDQVETPDGTRFRYCAAIDVKIPLAKDPGSQSLTGVAISFQCESMAPIPALLKIADSYTSDAWAPADQPTTMTVSVDPDSDAVIALQIPALDPLNVIKPGCKIELLKNEVVGPANEQNEKFDVVLGEDDSLLFAKDAILPHISTTMETVEDREMAVHTRRFATSDGLLVFQCIERVYAGMRHSMECSAHIDDTVTRGDGNSLESGVKGLERANVSHPDDVRNLKNVFQLAGECTTTTPTRIYTASEKRTIELAPGREQSLPLLIVHCEADSEGQLAKFAVTTLPRL